MMTLNVNPLELSIIERTCAAIGRYYGSLGKPYDDLFSTFCNENGIDDEDAFHEEMENEPNDCILVDFDDNFPFKKPPKDKAEFKYNLIKRCIADLDISFGSISRGGIPDFDDDDAELFNVKRSQLKAIRALYQTQCAKLYTNDWDSDDSLFTFFEIGRKRGFDYLLHLVDQFSRWRVQHQDKTYTEIKQSGWALNNPHFGHLQTIGVQSVKPISAVRSFMKRVCPELQLRPMAYINHDLEKIIVYINDAVNWVHSLATDPSTICPFQIDFCIAVGAPISAENKEELNTNSDDDEPDDTQQQEDEKHWVDMVGDIKQRLKENELKYSMTECPAEQESRIFHEIFQNFVKENDLKGSGKSAYLHQKRLITMIDRRPSKKDASKPDHIWMYEPPDDCQNIPNNAVPEWYINASATCLAPKSKKDEAFGVIDHCKQGTLTLSFHVKRETVIKCYLFWNGGMMRFMPDDIKNVLPQLFNPDKHPKRNEKGEKALDDQIKEMKEKLVDEEFDAFMSRYRFRY
eukprot:566068_1